MIRSVKDYYPIGSIVILKGAKKRVMIIGYLPITTERKVMNDYIGCLYPEGLIKSDKNLIFDHSQIDKVFFTGYKDEERDKFMEKIDLEMKKLNAEVVKKEETVEIIN